MRILPLAFALLTLSTGLASAQTRAEGELWLKLTKGPGEMEALEKVLEAPDEYSALILYGGAKRAFEQRYLEQLGTLFIGPPAAGAMWTLAEKRLEDAGFLFYAGQLRARFDRECFPPEGTGGDDPGVAYAAVSQTIGFAINPAVMDDPPVFEKVVARLKKWHPKAPDNYDPGYEHKQRKTEREGHEAAKPNRTDFLDHMSDLCTLFKENDYLAALRIVRAHNLADDDERPTKEAHDKALETMRRIEKEKGLKGVAGITDDDD